MRHDKRLSRTSRRRLERLRGHGRSITRHWQTFRLQGELKTGLRQRHDGHRQRRQNRTQRRHLYRSRAPVLKAGPGSVPQLRRTTPRLIKRLGANPIGCRSCEAAYVQHSPGTSAFLERSEILTQHLRECRYRWRSQTPRVLRRWGISVLTK